MTIPYRGKTSSSTYFVTANTSGKRNLLQSQRIADLFCHTLFRYRAEKRYLLHEFVVMPNHFHILLTVPTGATLERAMQCMKGGFSHEARRLLGLRVEIWQTSFLDRRVRNCDEYARFRTYILQNPVRAGLAVESTDFTHSSANPEFQVDEEPQWLKPQSEVAAVMQA